MHKFHCKCGSIQGQIDCKGVSNRLVCYCNDCQAFARYLKRTKDVLDAQGGTEIVQVAQSRLNFTQGIEHLAAVRLSNKGMVRWYAACCMTPIGNTMNDFKISFIGLIHSILDHSRMDTDFGKNIALVNTTSAIGEPKPKQKGFFGALMKMVWIIFSARARGQYKSSEFFNKLEETIVCPVILATKEVENLKNAE